MEAWHFHFGEGWLWGAAFLFFKTFFVVYRVLSANSCKKSLSSHVYISSIMIGTTTNLRLQNIAETESRSPDPKKAFGLRVRAERLRLGFSQETLAERTNLQRTYITDVERGVRNPSLETICKLGTALGISFELPLRSKGESLPPKIGNKSEKQGRKEPLILKPSVAMLKKRLSFKNSAIPFDSVKNLTGMSPAKMWALARPTPPPPA